MATMKKSKGSPKKELDRLSDLPDGLIHHILSFVDAKIAVQTCVLSKRWLCLWACLPVLNFDSQSFRTHAIFNKFVRRVLSGRRQYEPSNLLGLKFHSNSTDKSVLDRVIRYAVSHSVLKINMKHRRCLNDGLLTCATLRSLHLERCEISNDLFSRFMNLETLTLDGCYIFEEEKIKISAPRVVKLSISELNDDFYLPNTQEVVVSCPRLCSFCYEGRCPKVLSGDGGAFLTLVLSMDGCPILDRINIRITGSYKETIEVLSCCLWVKTLLQEMILHAKSLVVRRKGFLAATILSNDDVHAMVYNGATTEGGEDLWRPGTEQNFDQFVIPIVEWFEDQLWIEASGVNQPAPSESVAAMEAELSKRESHLQQIVWALQNHGIQVPEEPSSSQSTASLEARYSRLWLLMERITLTLESHGIHVPKPKNDLPSGIANLGTMDPALNAQHGAKQINEHAFDPTAQHTHDPVVQQATDSSVDDPAAE